MPTAAYQDNLGAVALGQVRRRDVELCGDGLGQRAEAQVAREHLGGDWLGRLRPKRCAHSGPATWGATRAVG